MGASDDLFTQLSSRLSLLSTPPLPLAPVQPLSGFLTHLTSTPVHAAYFPYLRFGALHAARCATVWAVMTRQRRAKGGAKAGLLGDLLGYLTVCWGGGTAASLLVGQPPSWLLSQTPWLTYLPIYLALVPTGMASYIQSTCPASVFALATAVIDGITRGTTICTVPKLLTAAGIQGTWWTTAVLSAIAVNGGGVGVQLMGLNEDDWKLGMPGILKGGVLNTLDVWGAALTGLLYASLMRLHLDLAPISNALAKMLPDDILVLGGSGGLSGLNPLTTPEHARAISVLFLIALFLARVITASILSPGSQQAQASRKKVKKMDKVDKEILEAVTHEKAQDPVVLQRTAVEGRTEGSKVKARGGTPKKSPKVKSG